MLLHGVARLLHTQRQAMLVWQACHNHHRKDINDSPAAAVDEKRSQVGAVKRTCKGHTGRAMFSERSNKEACSMKAQGHVAHRRMQDGVARLPGIVGNVQACPMTLLYVL
jgi:hypothetical protein